MTFMSICCRARSADMSYAGLSAVRPFGYSLYGDPDVRDDVKRTM